MNELENLIQVLDEGMKMLGRRAELLDMMSACLENREIEKLESMVEKSPVFKDQENALIQKISRHCRNVIDARGLQVSEDSLSALLGRLDGSDAMKLRERRQRLVCTIHEVRNRAKYLAEMAIRMHRVEERMLLAMFGQEDPRTYDSGGYAVQPRQGIALQHNA